MWSGNIVLTTKFSTSTFRLMTKAIGDKKNTYGKEKYRIDYCATSFDFRLKCTVFWLLMYFFKSMLRSMSAYLLLFFAKSNVFRPKASAFTSFPLVFGLHPFALALEASVFMSFPLVFGLHPFALALETSVFISFPLVFGLHSFALVLKTNALTTL